MKNVLKYIFAIISNILVLHILSYLPVNAYDVENFVTYDNLLLSEKNESYHILGLNDNLVTSVTIHSEFNNKPIFLSDDYHFEDCSNLKEILVDLNNKEYSSIDGVLFDKTHEKLIKCPAGKKGDYVVPEETKIICQYAFAECQSLNTISLPESILSVGQSAFENCLNLEHISGNIPINYYYPFQGCNNLKALTISGKELYNFSFKSFNKLESLIIKDTCYLSGLFIISNCSNLKQLILPTHDNLSAQGDFLETIIYIENCNSLEEITLPSYLKEFNIKNCHSLKKICIPEKSTNNCEIINCPSLKSFIDYRTISSSAISIVNNISAPPEDLVVYGYLGSGTDKFCKANHINFQALGDVSGDLSINVIDVILINKAILGKLKLTDNQNITANINKNDKVDSSDSLMIMKYIVGLINSFDV